MIKKVLGCLLLALNTSLAMGQTKTAPVEEWQKVFFETPAVALPLLTAAAISHSAQLKALNAEKSISQQDIQIAKESLLGSVSVGGSYTYGNLASISPADPLNPNLFNTYSSGRYSTGISVALPLDRLVSRGNLIKKEQLGYERTEAMRQDREDLLRQQVIQSYQNVLLARKLLTQRQESYVTVQTTSQLAERQFRQGQMSLPEFSQVTSQLTEISAAQEAARNTYDTTFLLLEELVGGKISTLMTTR
jgi:outer membrane protein TolC